MNSTLADIQALEAQTLLTTYTRIPLLLERGKGAYVFAADGRRYLDFLTGIGVNALGYSHPRITRVIREQAARLIHCSNLYYHDYQAPLAQRLTQLAGMERAFFTNSGTEALEGALKLARLHGRARAADKLEIVSLDNSFHGRTFGALSVTGQAKYRLPYDPGLPGVRFVPANDRAALAAAVGPRTAAVLVEPIQGEGGIIPLEAEFLTAAADLAREHGALLIADEIQCGLGRTGRAFAFKWTEVLPDLVVTAKPIACGLPLGVILARGAVAEAFTPGMHGTTFGGGPLACRVALEFLDIWRDERLEENVAARGTELQAALEALKRKQKAVQTVRGRGLMLGIELNRPAKPVVDAARELGLLANATHETVIRLLPPYNVTSALVHKAVRILARALRTRPPA
ncbi:MAG: aspartate aminotransferase family protein [Terriglobales bacterium]